MPQSQTIPLSGANRFPVERCHLFVAESAGAVQEHVRRWPYSTAIARGLGRSYGDSTLNSRGSVVSMVGLDRMIAFDETSGRLHAEAGLSVADILQQLLPRGWFVPTTPGTKFVTLGGAIAADVHGKNHHRDGSFGNHVLRIELLTADGQTRWCSPAEEPELFAATIGGMGLTGMILSAEVQLVRAPSAWCEVTYRRTVNLDAALEVLESTDRDYRYSVAWVDTLAQGPSLGRSVVMLANDASPDQLAGRWRDAPYSYRRRAGWRVPMDMPDWVVAPWSVGLFNKLFYARQWDRRQLVDYDRFFYPLDALTDWNRMYGKRGFVQYQALVPTETASESLTALLEKISEARAASFLSVLKKAGPQGRGMLSFLKPGFTLAMDLRNTGEPLRALARELDAILLRYGGRLYLAKDALTTAETFAQMYDQLPRFRQFKQRIDPQMHFVSSQARRLGIVEEV